MTNRRVFVLAIFAILTAMGLSTSAWGQANENNFATATSLGSVVRFDVAAANGGMTLTVSAPDGRSFSKDFRAGASPEFTITDKSLPDGVYTYELRLQPALSKSQRDSLKAGRGNDDEPESDRAARKRQVTPNMVQSGSFALLNGQIIVAGLSEDNRPRKASAQPIGPQPDSRAVSGNTAMRLRNHRLSLLTGVMPDQVIADDLIVQGSECAGLDCVNNESFGFDTIRLKENNTRISFVDTSSSAGFPTNDWTIRANSNASGGASFLAFVDRGATSPGDESGTIVFEVDAGAPANALKVSSAGKVGIKTATPVLDLHITGTDTPAIRQEQTSGGGFTAQTWDIGANEANWFVRDVTGGSRLPLRIRPGAPTSSIDISASGNVGVGTASPPDKISIEGSVPGGIVGGYIKNTAGTAVGTLSRFSIGQTNSEVVGLLLQFYHNDDSAIVLNRKSGTGTLDLNTTGGGIHITNGGSVGIATTVPSDTLSVNGTASKPGGGSWSVFSDERLKTIKGNFTPGLSAVMRLQPLRYQYKSNNPLRLDANKDYVGFGAQAVQAVIPEAVTRNVNGYLQINNDPILWTMLNAIKEQQQEIAQLKAEVQKLRRRSAVHRR